MSIHTSVIGVAAVVMSLALASVLWVAGGRGAAVEVAPVGVESIAPAAFY